MGAMIRCSLRGVVFASAFILFIGHAALADTITVEFSFTGSPDNFTNSCPGNNCFEVGYADPGQLSIEFDNGETKLQSFGSFAVTLYGNGGAKIDQPFTLNINQDLPAPDGETYTFSSQFTGRLSDNENSNGLTVEFSTYSQTITSGDITVRYSILPNSQTLAFGPGTTFREIEGEITATRPMLIQNPEPTSLLLLGTGMAILWLGTSRRKRK